MKWPFSRRSGEISKAVEAAESEKMATFDHTSLFLNGHELIYGSSGIDSAYQNSWVAYSCIRKLAQNAAGVPLLFLSDPTDKDSHVPATHPTRLLFEKPSPYFSTAEMIQWVVTMLNMRGEFFLPFDDPMRPTEMIPQTDPLHWKDIASGLDLMRWEYRNGQNAMVWLPNEIVHHRLVDPKRPFRGQSPLQAAATAYGIETGADTLTQNIVMRGGEKSAIYEADKDMTLTQRDQAALALKARRRGDASVARDVVLPNGVKPLDPKFIEDDTMVLEAGGMQPDKIMAVYGVPKSVLGIGTEEKYSNAIVKKRLFYEDTLVPQLTGITDSFDNYFLNLHSMYRCYIRFDWAAIPAMQDNLAERFDIAGKAKTAGLPWAVINTRLDLGLDTDLIPGANTVMVPSTVAPLDKLIEEWNAPHPSTPSGAPEPGKTLEGDKGKPRLTNSLIRKRARDTRSTIQRGIRIRREEREFSKQWRTLLQKYMVKATKAAPRIETEADAKKVLTPVFSGLGEEMGKLAGPHHESAALEGENSIIELVEGKMSDTEAGIWRKAHQWSPGVKDFLKRRTNLVVKMEDEIFAGVLAAVEETVVDGAEVAEVQSVIRSRFGSAPGGINRATTIARTEIGTAFNTARFKEMEAQDFEKHEWLTAAHDDVTRETHIEAESAGPIKVGDDFPGVNMPYPQYDGGDAEEVINCRCQTIPVLKER